MSTCQWYSRSFHTHETREGCRPAKQHSTVMGLQTGPSLNLQGPKTAIFIGTGFANVRGLRVSLNSLLLQCPWLQVEWATVEPGSLFHSPPCNVGW